MRGFLKLLLSQAWLVILLAIALIAFGWHATQTVPLDAIPNVGENQVIVLTEWSGRSPKDIEDQVTYPLSVALQAVPAAKSVRGKSMFGFSFVQVTFADDVDFYWARTRVSEQLATITGQLPEGATTQLAPDATALGQVFYYVLDRPAKMNLAEARSLQDYVIRYALQSVEGVAEVASIGGYEKQYQVEVDPEQLRFHRLSLAQLIGAVRESSIDVGAKTVESSGMEFIVRGRGAIGTELDEEQTLEQIRQTIVGVRDNVPLRIEDVATVQTGPSFRRGALDWNGEEAVGGVVVMRYGENPRSVIARVRKKIESLEPELQGARIVPIYDRTVLIDETVSTLTTALGQQVLITLVVITLFLLNVRASIAVAITLPIAVLMAFLAMRLFGVDANIMSLAGIAIAIGTMVDMGIIVSENIYGELAAWEADDRPGGQKGRRRIIVDAAYEVIPAVMTAVATTVVSFLPVFLLTGRDHRLFAPLAWTKTYALVASLIVAVVMIPVFCHLLMRTARWPWWGTLLASLGGALAGGCLTWLGWDVGLREWLPFSRAWVVAAATILGLLLGAWSAREELRPIERNPLSRLIQWTYELILRRLLKHKFVFLLFPLLIFFLGLGAWLGLPRLIAPAEQALESVGIRLNALPAYVDFKHQFPGLQDDDWIALDEGSWFYMPSLYPAASFSQAMEVLQVQDARIKQIPEVSQVLGKIGRIDSALDPAPAAMIETYVMLHPREHWREGITERDIWDQINATAAMPGVTFASALQPIEGRVVMLQSGIKASMAMRIYGDTLDGLSQAAEKVAEHLRDHPLVNRNTVNPDIVLGKPYLELTVDREQAARYGMTTQMVNQVISTGVGGSEVAETIEGRERYGIQVRFQRELRDDLKNLSKLPVVAPSGEVVPLEELAQISTSWGPAAISSEDARLVAHVSFSPNGRAGDLNTVQAVESSLQEARQSGDLPFPAGNFELEAVGSFQNQLEANRRLSWLVPIVIVINLGLIYFQFRKLSLALTVLSGIPVAFGGGMILLGWLDVSLNTAVWVGFIALFGIAVDDGVVMATYLEQAFRKRTLHTVAEVHAATVEAGLRRIRPCLMTTATTIVALLPVLVSTGRGADVARAMALPVFGGMCVELLTLFVVPVVYCGYQEWRMVSGLGAEFQEKEDVDSSV